MTTTQPTNESGNMNWDKAKTIGTTGGCGLVALAILKRCGGYPMLRYDADGNATHAAVKLNETVHLGDNDEGLVKVDLQELHRACKEDFDPSRACIESGDIKRVLQIMGLWS